MLILPEPFEQRVDLKNGLANYRLNSSLQGYSLSVFGQENPLSRMLERVSGQGLLPEITNRTFQRNMLDLYR